MRLTPTKIAAAGTLAALGVLGATAMGSGGAQPAPTTPVAPPSAQTRVAPTEVRTVVVTKRVNRIRWVEPAPVAPGRDKGQEESQDEDRDEGREDDRDEGHEDD